MNKIWLLGDSITYEYGTYFKPQWEASHPGDIVTVLGVGGETSRGGKTRALGLLSAATDLPTVAVLSWGTNDCVTLIDPNDQHIDISAQQTAENVRDMALALRAAGVRPIVGLPIGFPAVSSVPPEPPEWRILMRKLTEWCSDQRQALRHILRPLDIDFFPMPRRNEASFWADAFHPTWPNAEAIVAPGIATALTALGVV
jgi:lysophospholipase L1-like esterase